MKEILNARHVSGVGPASVDELFSEMRTGGFDFKDMQEDDAKRGMAVSLAKNSKFFYRLPNELWGLREWYDHLRDVKPSKRKTENGSEPDVVTDEAAVEEKAADFGESTAEDAVTAEVAKAAKG
jgi:hypothetical protein